MSKKVKKPKSKKGLKIKQGRKLNHISDKIYADRKSSVIGIYPITKKSKRYSVFHRALQKEFKNLFYKFLIWLCVLLGGAFVATALSKASVFISACLIIPIIIVCIISWVCYFLSFRGTVLEYITEDYADKISSALVNEIDKINLSDDKVVNSKNYTLLDTLSQVVDTEPLRLKKISILNSISDDYGKDWTYETDTVLLNYGNDAKDYLKKVNNIDPAKLGMISKRYMDSRK